MTSVEKAANTVKLTIDGIEVEAPKGALVIRVAEQLGIAIPRFCDHPLLAPAGACRHVKVMRRLAGDDPAVNEEWNCDKGRWAFQYANAFDRLTVPLVRDRKS